MIRSEFIEILEKEGNEKCFSYKNFDCKILRVDPKTRGHLCGYVVIPENHLLIGKDYDAIEALYDYELPTHGGLTFSGEVENEFWIGFDCAHLYDLSPCYPDGFEQFSVDGETYRDMAYVEQTLKNMVDFIINN